MMLKHNQPLSCEENNTQDLRRPEGLHAAPIKGFKHKVHALLQGPYAFWITVGIAFCESSFFPLPPDFGMMSIIIEDRTRAFRLALLCTLASVLGGILGYAIGFYVFETLGKALLNFYGLTEKFFSLKEGFHIYGFWILLLKGLTPLPYKLFTLASGAFHFSLVQFIIASFIARGGRFFILAAVLWYVGPKAKPFFERFMGWIMLFFLAMIGIGFFLFTLL